VLTGLQNNVAIKSLLDYLLSKISVNVEFHRNLTALLNQMSPTSPHVGLIIGERVYNMPPQVMPPSYKMLLEEMELASDDVCL
jgi:protein BCP1